MFLGDIALGILKKRSFITTRNGLPDLVLGGRPKVSLAIYSSGPSGRGKKFQDALMYDVLSMFSEIQALSDVSIDVISHVCPVV